MQKKKFQEFLDKQKKESDDWKNKYNTRHAEALKYEKTLEIIKDYSDLIEVEKTKIAKLKAELKAK